MASVNPSLSKAISISGLTCDVSKSEIDVSCLAVVYGKLKKRIYSCGLINAYDKIALDMGFILALRIFSRYSTVGQEISRQAMASTSVDRSLRFSKRMEAKVFSPELVVHASKYKWSTGQWHIDSTGSHHNDDYSVIWLPLFESEHKQLSIRCNGLEQGLNIGTNEMLRFSAKLEHKGNYNYTHRDHCSVVIRVTLVQGLHSGPCCYKSECGKIEHNMAGICFRMSHLESIAIRTSEIFRACLSGELTLPTFIGYISALPYYKHEAQWYDSIFNQWATILDDIGEHSARKCLEEMSG